MATQTNPLLAEHAGLKRIRGRGEPAPSHAAMFTYLRGLESELEDVRRALSEVWLRIDTAKDFRRVSRYMDAAQQRLHRAIKKLGK